MTENATISEDYTSTLATFASRLKAHIETRYPTTPDVGGAVGNWIMKDSSETTISWTMSGTGNA